MPSKGNAITEDARALWLRMRTDGGWWTLDQLAHHWNQGCAPCKVQHAMDALEAGGFVESRDHATNLSYGVTLNCQSLPGFDPCRPGQKALNEHHAVAVAMKSLRAKRGA